MRCLHFLQDVLHNAKLKSKLLFTYTIVVCIALFLLLLVLRAIIGKQLFSHEQALLADALNQSTSQLQSKINSAISLSEVIYNNENILSACNTVYEDRYFSMYTAYHDIIEPQLIVYKLLNSDIHNITIYTSCDLHPYKNLIKNVDYLHQQPWFSQIEGYKSMQWIPLVASTGNMLVALRKLPQNSVYPFENYLYLEYNYNDFFSPVTSISTDSYGLVIAAKDNSVIYQYHSFGTNQPPIDPISLASNSSDLINKYQNSYLFLSSHIPVTGWTIYYYRAVNTVRKTVNQTVVTAFMLISLCFTLLFFLTFITVNTFLSPLHQLTNSIRKISLEDVSRQPLVKELKRKDEIGTLIQAFNAMLIRIRNLIDEVYVQQLKIREYQLKALRAQINPHFLYNTLSLINARAIIAEQYEISETAQLLSQFYRTSLNHGQDTTTLGNEFENIQTYIAIQLLLSNNAFTVIYETDDSLSNASMINLILQPIVENALDHGLKNCHKPDRKLIISMFLKEDIIYITIRDNGIGMTTEELSRLLSHESHGIGMKNVDERLRLSYGEDMGLIIESIYQEGTSVTVRIPHNK